MDQLLQMIQSADPTDNQSDSVELLQLEGTLNLALKLKKKEKKGNVEWTYTGFWPQLDFSPGACNQMGPLIDQKLEDIDRYVVLSCPQNNFCGSHKATLTAQHYK